MRNASVAVCLVGAMRTFEEPRIIWSFRHHLIDVLQRNTVTQNGGRVHVDLFAVLTTHDATPKNGTWFAAKRDVDIGIALKVLGRVSELTNVQG